MEAGSSFPQAEDSDLKLPEGSMWHTERLINLKRRLREDIGGTQKPGSGLSVTVPVMVTHFP